MTTPSRETEFTGWRQKDGPSELNEWALMAMVMTTDTAQYYNAGPLPHSLPPVTPDKIFLKLGVKTVSVTNF